MHKLIRAKDDVEDIIDIVPVYQIKGISKLFKLCLPKVQCFCDSLTSPPSERQVSVSQLISGLTNGQKDLSWMAIQGRLLVRSFMHARNLCKTRYCPRCPFVEKTSFFWECRFAQHLLTALEDDLRNSVPRTNLSHHSVLYGLFPGVHTVGAIQEAWSLMNCFKDAI
ncbi:unnamed protein product [Ranitomeya imitator]|uniref:Reverse transcriptase zinc-binding domain-containing protein n=1 Tax=Ranitomeya imitator TaxID=111125 RepID=A0ABN9KQT8_9NEOB|nr:unnamed protein product [Ranitomeya imitator]